MWAIHDQIWNEALSGNDLSRMVLETEDKLLNKSIEGIVIKAQSGFFTVKTAQGAIISQVPGRLKKERQSTTLVAVGDQVNISIQEDGSGIIESVAERQSALSRTRTVAGPRSILSDREQVLVANPDQVIFVFSMRNPSPSLRKLDRFLVVAEMNQLPAVICVNKIDLTELAAAQQMFQVYEDIGYRVIYTSARERTGVEELRACLKGKLSVLTGSSGVGKSSLLNAVQPGLGLQVRAVSQATGKGLHTTRYAEMFPLDGGGYVADTPGIRGLAIFDVEPGELDAYFREIGPLVEECQFSDCSHRHEPKCAVKVAVANGQVSRARYDSYLRLREEHESLDQAVY
jgi:ribosome biogenesis GTPase